MADDDMNPEHPPQPRPYWHVDAKWITGLLLTFVLSLTLLVYGLVQITAEKPAVDTVSLVLALLYSPQGLDDETEIAEFHQQLQASPDSSIQPIPGLKITVREQDIATLTPREARLYFFRQLAEPLYQQGAQGLRALADDPQIREGLALGIGPLGIFTSEAHQQLQRVLVILGVIALALLVPLIVFSYRFGRLGSPGCALSVASLPGALLLTLLSSGWQPVTTPPNAESGTGDMLSYLATNVLPPLVQIIARGYVTALILGLGLVVLSVLGSLIWRLARKARPVSKPDEPYRA
jgi:hypothetical protein